MTSSERAFQKKLERIFWEIDPEKALAFDDTFYERVFDFLKNTSFILEWEKLDLLKMMFRKSQEKLNPFALSLGFRLLTLVKAKIAIEDLNFWLSGPLDCKFAKSLLEYCVFLELENDLVEDFALRALKSEFDFLTESACKILCKSARITEIIHSLLGSGKFGLLSKAISLAEASLPRINQEEMLEAFCAALERMQKRDLADFALFSRKCTQFPKRFLDLPCQFLFLNGHCVVDSSLMLLEKVKEFILVAEKCPQFLQLNLDFIEEHLESLKELPELWEFVISLFSRSSWLQKRAINLLERIPHSKSFSLPPVNANSFRLHLKVASSDCLDYLMLKLKEENAQDFESVLCVLQSCEWPFSQVDFDRFLSLVYDLFHDEHFEKDFYLAGTMIQFLCKHGKLNVFDILTRIENDSHLKLCALQCLGPLEREEFALLKSLVHDSDLEVRALVGKFALENANAFPKETVELIEILKNDESVFVRNAVSNAVSIPMEMTIDEYFCDFDAFLSANVSMSHDCYC